MSKSRVEKTSPLRPDSKRPHFDLYQKVTVMSGEHTGEFGDITHIEWDARADDWLYHVRGHHGYYGTYKADQLFAVMLDLE